MGNYLSGIPGPQQPMPANYTPYTPYNNQDIYTPTNQQPSFNNLFGLVPNQYQNISQPIQGYMQANNNGMITVKLNNGQSVYIKPDNQGRLFLNQLKGQANVLYLSTNPEGTITINGINGQSIPLRNDGQNRTWVSVDNDGNVWFPTQ
jgi:hypothetical protein